MESNAKFESEVLALLRRLTAKKDQLQAKFTKDLAEIDQQIEAVQTTAHLMREPIANGDNQQGFFASGFVVPPTIRGKSVRQACVEIAKHNHGILKVSDATKALLDAKVMTSKKHAWGATYTACIRSKDFEKDPTVKGVFRLSSAHAMEDGSSFQHMLTPPPVRPM